MANKGVPNAAELSRRERQVVEILARTGRASARDIQAELPDPPTYSAVRSILRILVGKGFIVKELEDGKDIFASKLPAEEARQGLLKGLVQKLFRNSTSEAACALLSGPEIKLSPSEADRLMKLIQEARKR